MWYLVLVPLFSVLLKRQAWGEGCGVCREAAALMGVQSCKGKC